MARYSKAWVVLVGSCAGLGLMPLGCRGTGSSSEEPADGPRRLSGYSILERGAPSRFRVVSNDQGAAIAERAARGVPTGPPIWPADRDDVRIDLARGTSPYNGTRVWAAPTAGGGICVLVQLRFLRMPGPASVCTAPGKARHGAFIYVHAAPYARVARSLPRTASRGGYLAAVVPDAASSARVSLDDGSTRQLRIKNNVAFAYMRRGLPHAVTYEDINHNTYTVGG
jgi:hypothetical protein